MRPLSSVVLALCVLVIAWWYGGQSARHQQEVNDMKGADIVQKTVEDTLDGIPANADPDSLLNDTQGFRD